MTCDLHGKWVYRSCSDYALGGIAFTKWWLTLGAPILLRRYQVSGRIFLEELVKQPVDAVENWGL